MDEDYAEEYYEILFTIQNGSIKSRNNKGRKILLLIYNTKCFY